MVEQRASELAVLLRESGYRLTPQRLGVLAALLEGDHPSAEDVYQRISAQLPTTSLATVYNTLDALRRIGQVLEIRPPQGGVRYDVRRPHQHPHLVCTRCGRVEDAPVAVPDSSLSAAETAESGWGELGARLEFEGVCPACRQELANG